MSSFWPVWWSATGSFTWTASRQPVAELPTQPEKFAVPAIRNPLPPAAVGSEQEKPLPELKESDPAMREVLAALFGEANLENIWNINHFVERFVLLVDSLPKRQLPLNRLPTRPVPGKFMTAGDEGKMVINPSNYRRYAPYIRLADALDTKKMVAVYIHYLSPVSEGL